LTIGSIIIRPYKQLNDEQIDFMVSEGMGMAGKLEGNTITAVKIPKDFHAWYEATDENLRKSHYCHCPRIREFIETGEASTLPKEYCLCGAGFYRHMWEFILERDVQVEVTESVIHGGSRCRIQIDIG